MTAAPEELRDWLGCEEAEGEGCGAPTLPGGGRAALDQVDRRDDGPGQGEAEDEGADEGGGEPAGCVERVAERAVEQAKQDEPVFAVGVSMSLRTERQRSSPINAAAWRVVNSARSASGKTSRNVVISSGVGCWNG